MRHSSHVLQGKGFIPEARRALREFPDFMGGMNESG
jgi:hypothetical protein